jgi:hypothetical protein
MTCRESEFCFPHIIVYIKDLFYFNNLLVPTEGCLWRYVLCNIFRRQVKFKLFACKNTKTRNHAKYQYDILARILKRCLQ